LLLAILILFILFYSYFIFNFIVAIGVGARLRQVLQALFMRHGSKVELRALCDESRETLEIAKKWPYKFNVPCCKKI
jgi:hypothetical protein